MEALTHLRDFTHHWLYKHVVKPVFFARDPEVAHDAAVRFGVSLGRRKLTRWLVRQAFSYEHPSLAGTVAGIHFKNSIGLSAGFDKNAELLGILPAVGFGFAEVGSVTGEPCAGNPRPRLWRLPGERSLVVHYGLKNDGAWVIAKRLRGRRFGFPVGVSIAKTNCAATVDTAAGIADCVKTYRALHDIGDYVTINVSCPNTFGGAPFTDPARLDELLHALDVQSRVKPTFIKISPDLGVAEVDEILVVVKRHKITGLVIANLTKDRSALKKRGRSLSTPGGLSGKLQEPRANALMKYIYGAVRREFVLIGSGGIFSAADAYQKIKLGASLVQLITGMVFEGPQLISEIKQGLVRLLKADGFTSVSEAVGRDVV